MRPGKEAYHVKSHEAAQVKSGGEFRNLGTRNVREIVKYHERYCYLKALTIWGFLFHVN